MSIMDILIDELNKNTEGGAWERLHSEQYRIVETDEGIFHVRKHMRKETETWEHGELEH